MLVEREVPADGFVYDHPKRATVRRYCRTTVLKTQTAPERYALDSSIGLCRLVCELEDKRYLGSEMIVSRPKSATQAWQVWLISMLAFMGKFGKMGVTLTADNAPLSDPHEPSPGYGYRSSP